MWINTAIFQSSLASPCATLGHSLYAFFRGFPLHRPAPGQPLADAVFVDSLWNPAGRPEFAFNTGFVNSNSMQLPFLWVASVVRSSQGLPNCDHVFRRLWL